VTVHVLYVWSRVGLELTKRQENSGFLSCLCNSNFEARPRGEAERDSNYEKEKIIYLQLLQFYFLQSDKDILEQNLPHYPN